MSDSARRGRDLVSGHGRRLVHLERRLRRGSQRAVSSREQPAPVRRRRIVLLRRVLHGLGLPRGTLLVPLVRYGSVAQRVRCRERLHRRFRLRARRALLPERCPRHRGAMLGARRHLPVPYAVRSVLDQCGLHRVRRRRLSGEAVQLRKHDETLDVPGVVHCSPLSEEVCAPLTQVSAAKIARRLRRILERVRRPAESGPTARSRSTAGARHNPRRYATSASRSSADRSSPNTCPGTAPLPCSLPTNDGVTRDGSNIASSDGTVPSWSSGPREPTP